MKRLPSPSSLYRVKACPGSEALPHFAIEEEGAVAGTILHRFLQRVPAVGRDLALEEAPEEYRESLGCVDLSRLPACEPERFQAEVAMAYDVATFRARLLPGVEARRYEGLAPTEFPGTIDVLGVTDEAVIVYDYKREFAPAAPAAVNWQLKTYALMAARHFGKERAKGGIIRIGANGDSWYDVADYSADALDAHELELVELLGRVADGAPDIVEGTHCRYCPALPVCPAKLSLVRQVVTLPAQVEQAVQDMLAEGRGAEAWTKVKAAKALVERLDGIVRDYATSRPIDLGDGMVLGKRETERESLNGEVAHRVLAEKFGADIADAAAPMERSTTKSAVEKALRVVVERGGGRITKLVEATIDAVRDAGGVAVKKASSVTEFRRPRPKDAA